ncbi:recombinase family protein [Enterococcus sp. CWB-B31]|uniref:recombinase family protein n=1 Tax=Enterococcus sp. CWB-B31 TaxID=2885159 RepID=UPI001E5432EB|nr:recombinase family protein [Enterococcus sp. CWB-B31]MCB5954394.1 recombinase family protein [Enterococcus sp. CWB-B31]
MHKLAALYSRSATDDRQDVNKQITELNNYCEENNIQNFKHYIDKHQSGVKLDRPAFKKLIQDLEAGKIDKIFVIDISRISRNFSEIAQLIHYQIEPNHAKLIALGSGDYRLDDYNPENGFFTDLLTRIKSDL